MCVEGERRTANSLYAKKRQGKNQSWRDVFCNVLVSAGCTETKMP